MTRDTEKLKAIGYKVDTAIHGFTWCDPIGTWRPFPWEPVIKTETEAWEAAKKDALAPKNMKTTMADKVRWLLGSHDGFHIDSLDISLWKDGSFVAQARGTKSNDKVSWNGEEAEGGDSPEAAVDALFWEVP